MSDAGQLSAIQIILFTFVPMFICAALLRASGALGIVAIVGLFAIGIYLFIDLEGGRLMLGLGSAMVGLVLGGKVSDAVEHNRMKKVQDAENRKREAKLTRL